MRSEIQAIGIVMLAAGMATVFGAEPLSGAGVYSIANRYLLLKGMGGRLVTLRCDALGKGEYSPNTLAEGEGLSLAVDGVGLDAKEAKWKSTDGRRVLVSGLPRGATVQVSVAGPELRIAVEAKGTLSARWSTPFLREGYYDVDAHRNYLEPISMKSTPLLHIFRKFVSGTGNARYIEELKRVVGSRPSSYGSVTPIAPLWVGESGRFLACSDRTLNYDLKVTWPGADQLNWEVGEKHLTLAGPLSGALTFKAQPRGEEAVPDHAFEPLAMRFSPDREITQSLTRERVSINSLLADFLQQGLYFHPGVIMGGDWFYGATFTHQLDDPRSPYLQRVRDGLSSPANIGYDRYGRFGYMYCWDISPNYGDSNFRGDPGFLWPTLDVRHLHVNWVFIVCAARYALTTGDKAFLRARRTRRVSTDGAEPQPICGIGESFSRGLPQSILNEPRPAGVKRLWPDPVLIKGDWRLDFQPPTVHTLGQSFTANAPFRKATILLGNHEDTSETAIITLKKGGPNGETLATDQDTLPAQTFKKEVAVIAPRELPPGKYHIALHDPASGKQWVGGGLKWWTNPEENYAGGEAYNAYFHGQMWDQLKLLFDYCYHFFGPNLYDVAAYDKSYGYSINRSGRKGDPMVCNSAWEMFGGGKDMWASLWYNQACTSMADLADFLGLPTEADNYRELRRKADAAFHKTFGLQAKDNGKTYFRYHACEDWDGKIHDYGFAHYNLEAVARGIPDADHARRIMWWLDRGQYSPDGGKTWKDHIYDFWQIAPPFITINDSDWMGWGGRRGGFIFGETVTMGGARLLTAAPDLIARSRVLGIDNTYERAEQVLNRYARPDRLTGGRAFSDSGGRGRWHFGPPNLNIADIEGFRETFSDNGFAASALPFVFLGIGPKPEGLQMNPLVPSAYDGFEVTGLGFNGLALKVTALAQREEVSLSTGGQRAELSPGRTLTGAFHAAKRFNRVGVQAFVAPKGAGNVGVSLNLTRKLGDDWESVWGAWLSHVDDGEWLWITAQQWLEPDDYRMVLSRAALPPNVRLFFSAKDDDLAVWLQAAKTLLKVENTYGKADPSWTISGAAAGCDRTQLDGRRCRLETVIEPVEQIVLTRGASRRH